jgi:hypothetical protein
VPYRGNRLKDGDIASSDVVPEPFTGKEDDDNGKDGDNKANNRVNWSSSGFNYNNASSVSELFSGSHKGDSVVSKFAKISKHFISAIKVLGLLIIYYITKKKIIFA